MATSSVMAMDVMPSVHRPLSQADLATSLPRIDADLKAPDEDRKALVRMIIDRNMAGKLAVHLLHSHEPLKPGKVSRVSSMFNFNEVRSCKIFIRVEYSNKYMVLKSVLSE
ncbi:hypothetical protein IFR05_015314 [Cadophora sp. M221]|nr:hypothetical protein IFR05_015314 [Cadophora sp. M221]